jgi:hypothetical protein
MKGIRRIDMKRHTLSAIAIGAGALLAASSLLAHSGPCTLHSVAGTYGYTISGNVLAGPAAGPTAGAGIITLNDDGTLSDGKQTRSFNGSIADETTDGTYTVNDDCTGEFTVNVYDSGGNLIRTSQLHAVWDDGSSEIRGVFRTPFTAINVTGRKRRGND